MLPSLKILFLIPPCDKISFPIQRLINSIPIKQALNEGIEVLNLRWNCIRGKGGVAIANALSVSFLLFFLNFLMFYFFGSWIWSFRRVLEKDNKGGFPLKRNDRQISRNMLLSMRTLISFDLCRKIMLHFYFFATKYFAIDILG